MLVFSVFYRNFNRGDTTYDRQYMYRKYKKGHNKVVYRQHVFGLFGPLPVWCQISIGSLISYRLNTFSSPLSAQFAW